MMLHPGYCCATKEVQGVCGDAGFLVSASFADSRSKSSFSSFVSMLADLHGADSERQHDCLRFEHHWMLFEILLLLWEHAPAQASDIHWPLDSTHTHSARDFHGCLNSVMPLLQKIFCAIHARQPLSRKPC